MGGQPVRYLHGAVGGLDVHPSHPVNVATECCNASHVVAAQVEAVSDVRLHGPVIGRSTANRHLAEPRTLTNELVYNCRTPVG